MSFWKELKRRNVYKVGVAYAIVAWLLIQAAAIIFPHLNLPSWAVTLVIVILIIGFPLALLLAWAYEVTPEGIKRTKQVPLAESITHLTGKKLNYILAGLLVMAMAFLLFDNYYLDRRVVKPDVATIEPKIEPKQVPTVVDVEEEPKTIAVIPFVNLSSDPEQEYFVDGLSEEILNSLCQIPDLNVIARTSSFSFKGTTKTVQEIASVLGVDNVLEGSVRKAGSALRITTQLVRAIDGVHIWSKTYDRELKDIFAVQEDIATAVASELKMTLGLSKSFRPLGGTDNLEAYKYYLIAKGQYNSVDTKGALESLDKALAIDPNFALAWASKAIIHTFLIIDGPADQIVTEQDAALGAAQRAIELEPNMAAGYYSLGYIKMARGDYIAGGLAYRKALELTDEPLSFIMPVIAIHYLAVGNFQKANVFLKEMLQKDPLNQAFYGFYIYSLGFLGDLKGAKQEHDRANILFRDQWDATFFHTLVLIGAGEVLSPKEIVYSNPIFNAAKEHLDSPREGITELRRIYNDENLNVLDLIFVSMWAAYFGDPEFAMDAVEEALSSDAGSVFNAWYPVMREVRQLPRFKKFISEIGLVDYWNEFGWPDICHKLDNGDFECD